MNSKVSLILYLKSYAVTVKVNFRNIVNNKMRELIISILIIIVMIFFKNSFSINNKYAQ